MDKYHSIYHKHYFPSLPQRNITANVRIHKLLGRNARELPRPLEDAALVAVADDEVDVVGDPAGRAFVDDAGLRVGCSMSRDPSVATEKSETMVELGTAVAVGIALTSWSPNVAAY